MTLPTGAHHRTLTFHRFHLRLSCLCVLCLRTAPRRLALAQNVARLNEPPGTGRQHSRYPYHAPFRRDATYRRVYVLLRLLRRPAITVR